MAVLAGDQLGAIGVATAWRGLVRRDGGLALEARPLREPGSGEALVRVELTGVCRTDLHAARGRVPVANGRVLGHEFVGTIESLGNPGAWAVGQRVVARPILGCGACSTCRAGLDLCCAQGEHLGLGLDGSFAERCFLPTSLLVPVPAALPAEVAACVEPVAAALAVLDAGLPPGGEGVVLGQGRIAELTLRVLQAAGHRVRLLPPSALAPASVDFAVETGGDAACLAAAVQGVRAGGTVVLKSRPQAPVAFDLHLAVRRQLTLRAVGWGDFAMAVAWLASGRLSLAGLLGPVYALADWPRGLARAEADEAVKVFLRP